MIFSMFCAYSIAGIYNRSIYINSVRAKNIPWLLEFIPYKNRFVTADTIMTTFVHYLKPVASVKQITEHLILTNCNGYPVVDGENRVCGLMSRDYLMILLKHKVFSSLTEEPTQFLKKEKY